LLVAAYASRQLMDGAEAEPGARFALVRELGRGGAGVVWEAHDREWDVRVALKMLRSPTPEGLVRLKNEFRAIEGIRHPNLVRLGELYVDGGQWLFTMELVEGVDFLRWVNGDPKRLREAARQLASALHALHESGRVHRDVKPSNVLVTREGRVVLLDFGLITRVAADDTMTEGLVVGTPAYMAPEQADGRPVTPAADWYSFGVLLREADATGELVDLCAALLERDPDRRAGWRALAAQLEIEEGAGEHVEAPFVGRARELEVLWRALAEARERGPRTLFLSGESGIGKSMLAREFGQRLEECESGALVLSSHASDRELVPFNGFDGIVDGLMRHLAELPEAERSALLPADADALAALFPVMARLPSLRAAVRGKEAAPGEPASRRRRGFVALKQLLAALARRGPLVLIVDDFQWAGDDTMALRRTLMDGAAAPGWLLVATVRNDAQARAIVHRARLSTGERRSPVEELELQPLSPAESEELVGALGGDGFDVASAHGHPLFLAELARAGGARAHDVGSAIAARVEALGSDALRLLEVLAIGCDALRPSLAAAAAELDPERYARAADELRAARLARAAGAGSLAGIEPYHDAVRQAVLSRLPPERQRALHRALAQALEAAGPGVDLRRLFVHWLGAGENQRAAAAAEAAAAEADRQLAFAQAAEYYAHALSLGGTAAPRGPLLFLRARALANAGKKREAVAASREAAEAEQGSARLDHLRSAAEVLLGSGDIDEGVALLRQVLDGVGLRWPAGPGLAMLSLAATRVRIRLRGLGWSERPASSLSLRTLARIDTAFSAAMVLTLVDRARAADFQARGLLLSLRAGEPYRVARAVILEAGYSCMGGSHSLARTHALLDEGRALAERSAHPHALAMLAAVEGIAHSMEGDFQSGARRIELAVPLLRASASRWDTLNAEYLLLMSLSLLGELREVERRVAVLMEEAEATDDLSLLVNLTTGYPPLARLARDDSAGARRAAEESMARWSHRGFHRQHWSALFARANCDLYDGDGERVWRALAEARVPLWRSLLLHSQPVRIAALNLRARAALATGRIHAALRCAERLSKEGVGWAEGMSLLAHASVYPSSGAFLRAAATLEAAGLRLHAAVARRRAGTDDPYWREQAVANPDGFVRCFSPGGRS
jgi:eukaryotic-like serine/threonine-protein kinase